MVCVCLREIERVRKKTVRYLVTLKHSHKIHFCSDLKMCEITGALTRPLTILNSFVAVNSLPRFHNPSPTSASLSPQYTTSNVWGRVSAIHYMSITMSCLVTKKRQWQVVIVGMTDRCRLQTVCRMHCCIRIKRLI